MPKYRSFNGPEELVKRGRDARPRAPQYYSFKRCMQEKRECTVHLVGGQVLSFMWFPKRVTVNTSSERFAERFQDYIHRPAYKVWLYSVDGESEPTQQFAFDHGDLNLVLMYIAAQGGVVKCRT